MVRDYYRSSYPAAHPRSLQEIKLVELCNCSVENPSPIVAPASLACRPPFCLFLFLLLLRHSVSDSLLPEPLNLHLPLGRHQPPAGGGWCFGNSHDVHRNAVASSCSVTVFPPSTRRPRPWKQQNGHYTTIARQSVLTTSTTSAVLAVHRVGQRLRNPQQFPASNTIPLWA